MHAQQQRWHWPRGARLTRSERLHVTLHFLTRVPDGQVADVADAGAVSVPPFELALQDGGLWQGVAWLRPARPPAELLELHRRLGEAIARLRLPVDARSFEPHVTLARDARGAQPPAQAGAVHWPVGGHVLVASVLGPGGGYQVLRHYPWRAG
ncbi:RNA 2',3'-cyclic phosphodiesterase [Eleftheria terrae]|nr:RNA 2',3'-cyclic phosphodiesterase [Eleftheria terrae]WKB55088.1 RNA 2',3'-cyclic phosphodiesterase [Eleftheria terrae]